MRKLLTVLTALAVSAAASAAAFGGSMTLLGVGKAQSGGGTPSFTVTATPAWQSFPGTTASFSSVALGTVGTNNITGIYIGQTNAGSVGPVTIGGSTATCNFVADNGPLCWVVTPSATGTISITNGTSINSIGIVVFQITNVTTLGAPSSDTPFGFQTGTWNVGSGVTIPTNGIGAVAVQLSTTTSPTLTGFTLDATSPDTTGVSTNVIYFGHTTTTGALTPTVNYAGNGLAQISVFSP